MLRFIKYYLSGRFLNGEEMKNIIGTLFSAPGRRERMNKRKTCDQCTSVTYNVRVR